MKPNYTFPTLTLALAALVTLIAPLATAFAEGTAFTYQGRLNFNGGPAAGNYDFRFRLASDALGNTDVGSAAFTNAVPVVNGLFLTTLDFGAGLFTGGNLWLQIEVKTNGSVGYTTLNPLQALTPTPYAMFANTASNVSGTVSAAQNCSGFSSTGVGLDSGMAQNCYGESNGIGLQSLGNANNCWGYSSFGTGLSAYNASFCTGYRPGGTAIQATIATGCNTINGTNIITYKYNMP